VETDALQLPASAGEREAPPFIASSRGWLGRSAGHKIREVLGTGIDGDRIVV
jgi:hypothetical protein